MKVAFLTMGKDIGGAKQDVLTLSQKIAAHGHDVFVIAAPGVMDRELTGTPVQFIPAEFYVRRPWGLWKASRYLLRVVRENNIELVNPQGFFYGNYCMFDAFQSTSPAYSHRDDYPHVLVVEFLQIRQITQYFLG